MEGFFIPDVLISRILERPGPGFHVLLPETAREKWCSEPPCRSEVIKVRFVPQVSGVGGQGTTKGQVFYPSTSGLKGDLLFSFIALEKYW